ncbi:MAG: metallophosphoesterase [Planctomycetaceae bacterium]|nr:metallophosphoesterase [Planctomycetaceae bacterium]
MSRFVFLCPLTLLVLTSACLADAAYPTPWVAGVTKDSVYVSLEATDTIEATVQFGTTTSYGMTATTENTQATDAPTYVHNIKLTGLLPNTEYHYRVTQGSSVSADYSFWTAPLAGTSVRWGYAADSRAGSNSAHNTIAGLIASYAPKMMVYGGDIAHYATRASYNAEWFQPNQAALNATTPWVNAVGNHETWGSVTKAFTQSPTGDPDYFSFDYGDAHILVLNSMIPHGLGSAQWDFAAADLAASTQTWKIVVSHYPPYAWRDYWGDKGDADFRDMADAIFEPNGVDMVLSGDSHFYQHSLVDGIEYMVLGSFGAPLYVPTTGPGVVYSESTYSFGIFDMTSTSLTFNTYRMDNSQIESIVFAIPEPATVTLLGLGAIAMLRKRRN